MKTVIHKSAVYRLASSTPLADAIKPLREDIADAAETDFGWEKVQIAHNEQALRKALEALKSEVLDYGRHDPKWKKVVDAMGWK